MSARPRLALLLAVTAATAATAPAQGAVGRSGDSWTTTQRLASGQLLRLTSPNGAMTIAQGSGPDVVITVNKRADRDGSIEDIGFVVKRSDAGVIVCAVRDDTDECDMERGYRQRESRNRMGRYSSARAEFTVQIPAGVKVDASTGNGDVTISGAGVSVAANTGNGRVMISRTDGFVRVNTGNGRVTIEGANGPVTANSGNGDIRVTTSRGPVVASTGNGDIDVSMSQIDRASEMKFSTGSGRIVVSLPANYGGELEGTTGNGRISSDLPIRVQGRMTPSRMYGTIGNGGERLLLTTGNGDIAIRRAH